MSEKGTARRRARRPTRCAQPVKHDRNRHGNRDGDANRKRNRAPGVRTSVRTFGRTGRAAVPAPLAGSDRVGWAGRTGSDRLAGWDRWNGWARWDGRTGRGGPGPLLLRIFCLPCLILLLLGGPGTADNARAAACPATGSVETTEADVHAARMAAKVSDGTFDFSSGAMDAAKECAELLNRLSRVSLGGLAVPSREEIFEAVREATEEIVEDTVEEACRYVATTSSNWVRSQMSLARQSASNAASDLVGARVDVTRPDPASVAATYRSRFRQGLPTYSDLPSLRDLR